MQFAPNSQKIRTIAKELRVDVLTMINAAGSGHTAGSLGMADVFATLYCSTNLLCFDALNPKWDKRDIVILSNAHINPILYATLSKVGYFEKSELLTLRKFGSRLQGHPNNHSDHGGGNIGIETSGGPLAQGMSIAVGFALSKKLKKNNSFVFCFCSDGELNEGQAWESIMSASKYKLNNLIFVIDRNNIQIDGESNNIMPLEPLHEKFKSFGCDVLNVDGHDIDKIYNAFLYAKRNQLQKPVALIMHTIPGKGVGFMENNYKWHGKAPNNEELSKALKILNQSK